jgi:RimK family alpha-L-glutamate ligase
MKKHIIFFFSGKNPYRIKRLHEATSKQKISHEFIDINTIAIDNHSFIENKFIKPNYKNIGYFLGYSEISKYLIDLFSDQIFFPQSKSWTLADKFTSHIFLTKNNIKTPGSSLILSHNSIDKAATNIGGFPCVIKKTTGGNGKLVALVTNTQECIDFILEAKENITEQTLFPRSFSFLLQKQIVESYGTDYRALCIGNNLVGIMQRTASNNSFKANFSLGGNVKHINHLPEIEQASLNIMKKSGLFMAGIDFIKSDIGYLVLEINTSPQFQGFEQATNINVADKIVKSLLDLEK